MVDQDQDSPLHGGGDILEAILSHAPLTDLVPASLVSKSWRRAVTSSPSLLHCLEPWLLLHSTTTQTTSAYDPRASVWIVTEPRRPLGPTAALLQSSHPNLLYALSPSRLSFSVDPLHLTWRHSPGPAVWRVDPVIALVGRRIVVAGGVCGFEDDPLAVEAYDVDSGAWTPRESMPPGLKDSAASTWLSAAVYNNHTLFVTEKCSGTTHAFDPETDVWAGPYDLRPDLSLFSVTITCFEDRLIVVGLLGEAEEVGGVRLWGVNIESFECELMGEMPSVLVEKLRSESYTVSSVGVCLAGNILFIYVPGNVEEIFTCEFVGNGGGCRWGSVRSGRSSMERVVVTGSEVGFREVEVALAAERRRFTAEVTGAESA